MITKFSRLLIVLAAFATLTITSCKKDKFDEPPHNTTDPNIANATIADLRALFTSGNPITINDDIIVGGVVTADDKSGNFYKTIVIQDETGAIPVLINKSGLNADYPIGRKIYVKCQGLVLGQYGKNVQLGGFIDYTGAQPSVGNIASAITDKIVIKGPTVTALEPKHIARLSDLNFTTDQSLLIQLDPVEFLDGNVPYADIVNGNSLSRTIKDCFGDLIDVRTSNFASFASSLTPATGAKVSIIGVYSVFNGTRQLTIRETTEVVSSLTPCGPDPGLPTITIAALRAKFPLSTNGNGVYPAGANPIIITDDVNITGIVTANDRSGNFYKQIVIQDATGAIPILINDKDLYKQFEIGRRIYVRVRGTVLGQYGKNLQLGNYIDSSGSTLAVGSIYADYVHNFIYNGAMEAPIVPRKISSFSDLNLNTDQSTLVQLDPVTFAAVGQPYADVLNGTSLTRIINDCNSVPFEVRTSNFANFATQNTPSGSVSLIGIYSVFGTSATFAPKPQFAIREFSEITTGSNCPTVLFNENFSGASVPASWQNYKEAGSKNWYVPGPYLGNYLVKCSAYGSTDASNIAWLITPAINLTGYTAKTLTFNLTIGQIAGTTSIDVLISTNYSGTGDPNAAGVTWTALPFTAPALPTSGNFGPATNSTVNLNTYTGTVYVAYKYTGSGSGGGTTTYEVDDVKVVGQ